MLRYIAYSKNYIYLIQRHTFVVYIANIFISSFFSVGDPMIDFYHFGLKKLTKKMDNSIAKDQIFLKIDSMS